MNSLFQICILIVKMTSRVFFVRGERLIRDFICHDAGYHRNKTSDY